MTLTNIGPFTGTPINQDTDAETLHREVSTGTWLFVVIVDPDASHMEYSDLSPEEIRGARAIVVGSQVEYPSAAPGNEPVYTFDVELGDLPHLLTGVTRDQYMVLGACERQPGAQSKTLGMAPQLKARLFDNLTDKQIAALAEGIALAKGMPTEAAIAEARSKLDVAAEAEAVAEEAAPGKSADRVTKLYLRDRKNPVLIHGDLQFVERQIWGRADRQPKFQIVTRDGMVSHDEIVVNRNHVVSISSDRFGIDDAPTQS